MVFHLFRVPADADAEQEAAAGDLVDRGDELRGLMVSRWFTRQTPVPIFRVLVAAAAMASVTNGSMAS